MSHIDASPAVLARIERLNPELSNDVAVLRDELACRAGALQSLRSKLWGLRLDVGERLGRLERTNGDGEPGRA
jgi:hypothetical protein